MIDVFLAQQHLPAPAPPTPSDSVEACGASARVYQCQNLCKSSWGTYRRRQPAELVANAELGRGPDIIPRIVTRWKMPSQHAELQVALPASNNTELKDGIAGKVCLCFHKLPVDF